MSGLSLQLHSALHLGERAVLQPLLLNLRAGEWTAVVGPNGAGKSTLLRALAGLLAVDGQLLLDGRPWSAWRRDERARQVAWCGAAEGDTGELTVAQTVMLGRLPHQGWLGLPAPLDHAAVHDALRAVQAEDWAARRLQQLSAGERQRVLLARALAVQAPWLLLDEPLAHLDPPHQADWLRQMREQAHSGRAVVSVLHELHLALRADRLLVLHDGHLRYDGRPDGAHDALQAAFAGRLRLLRDGSHWIALPH